MSLLVFVTRCISETSLLLKGFWKHKVHIKGAVDGLPGVMDSVVQEGKQK